MCYHTMRVAHHPSYTHPLPAAHRFPMVKYELLAEQLKIEGIVEDLEWVRPDVIHTEAIHRAHSPSYVETLEGGLWTKQEERQSGFPWSAELIHREKVIMEGTRMCAQWAAQGKVGLNIAGGTHHAYRDHAEGFCLLNDLAIAAYDLIDSGLERILIVDLDVHHGNGTAEIVGQDPRIFTFSMHGAKNYPMKKPPSTLDIALPDQTGDGDYLALLDDALNTIFTSFRPQVALFQCGVDVLVSDKLGRLSLSLQGCAQRDHMVFSACKDAGIGVACAMGGGYSKDVNTIVKAHTNTFRIARDVWT